MKHALQRELTDASEPGEDARHRLCAVTRERLHIDAMIRFVAGPDGKVVPDLRCKLPGRGIWVTLAKTKVADAIARKAFGRGLKKPVEADPALPELIEHLLQKQALDALSFANKAGCLILGFERVVMTITDRKAYRLLHASDAGADGTSKLAAKQRTALTNGPDAAASPPPSIDCFSNLQLSLALAKPNVVHGALIDAPAARNFVEQTERLLRYGSH
jgi:uncharacterized protein